MYTNDALSTFYLFVDSAGCHKPLLSPVSPTFKSLIIILLSLKIESLSSSSICPGLVTFFDQQDAVEVSKVQIQA